MPFLNQDPKALNVVQYILESCLLRREKTMRDKDGRLIVDLPPKTVRAESVELSSRQVDIQVLDFSRPERQIYKYLEDRAKRRFIQLDEEGKAMSNYTSILAMLMKWVKDSAFLSESSDRRLRQCVDHPLLVLGKGANEAAETDDLLGKESKDEKSSIKEMIAAYAGGARHSNGGDGDETANGDGDSAYAQQVLKELGESEQESECFICTGEIFDEVLLPCYHRG